MIIGIDIGGTNTDAILVSEDKKIVASVKETTQQNIEEGVKCALIQLQKASPASFSSIQRIAIGSTYATNAILEEKGLLSVGVIRLAGHRPDLAPGASWPHSLKQKVILHHVTVGGGYECHGREITPFSLKEVERAVLELVKRGVQAMSIVGVYSCLNHTQEKEAERVCKELLGEEFPVTISSDIGGIGFLERENATILNSSLKRVVQSGFEKLKQTIKGLGIEAPVYMVHNDGSLMDIEEAVRFPIFTISCGQTNSFRGASALMNLENALVIDVGGTSTDLGLVENGVIKRSSHFSKIGGVKLQFAIPDALSLSIGGGSVVKEGRIGPESVARKLKQDSLAFGGKTCTFTDLAIQSGRLEIEGVYKPNIPLSQEEIKRLLDEVDSKVANACRIMQGKRTALPLILVGGGASLILQKGGVIPPFSYVANAYGAALSGVSATVDVMASLESGQNVQERAKEEAICKVKAKGAKGSICISNIEIIPYAYSDKKARFIVTATGSL